MHDISGFGLQIQMIASVTFPAGITLTQFADDADPFDVPALKIAEATMGLNGDGLKSSKASVIPITINLIPDLSDDVNMSILLDQNRVAKGKNNVKDVITMTAIFPDGSTTTLTGGTLTDGSPSTSIASAGRKKTKVYTFAFENTRRTYAIN